MAHMHTAPARRVVAAALGLGLALTLGACGMDTRQKAAAIIDGDVITQDELATATQQLNDVKIEVNEQTTLMAYIAAPFFTQAAKDVAQWTPGETYATYVARIPNATPETKKVLEFLVLANSQQLDERVTADYQKRLHAAKISVNPAYGAMTAEPNPLAFKLGPAAPNWIATTAAATAPAG